MTDKEIIQRLEDCAKKVEGLQPGFVISEEDRRVDWALKALRQELLEICTDLKSRKYQT